MSKLKMSRRTLIRGAGVGIALPFLEAMLPSVALAQVAGKPKVRFLTIYKPDGIVKNSWNEVNGNLPDVLSPLAPYRSDMSLLLRLPNPFGAGFNLATHYGNDGHAPAITRFLTGGDLDFRKAATNSRTLDHIIADGLGKQAYYIAPDDQTSKGPTFDQRYFKYVSWYGPGPADKLSSPQRVYQRLFAQGMTSTDSAQAVARAKAYKKSLLDFALGEINRVAASVGAADKAKLDEYFTSLRKIEQQANTMPTTPMACQNPTVTIPSREANYYQASGFGSAGTRRYEEWVKLNFELIFHAMQCDDQQVISYQFGDEVNIYYLQNIFGENLHEVSHYLGGNSGNAGDMTVHHNNINKWFIQQLADLVKRLKQTVEPDGKSILDKSMIHYGVGLSDSQNHDMTPSNILIGKANGRLNPAGRYVSTSGQTHANLLLKMLNVMGDARTNFGNSTGPLTGV